MNVPRSTRIAFLCLAVLLFQTDRFMASAATVPPGACLYALDSTADRAFQIAGAQSVYTACGVIVESRASDGFEMEGSETLYLKNHAQVSIVGGAQLNGQKLWDTISNKQVQPVQVSSSGDPLASIAAPTTGTIVSKTPVYFDMNSKPANNTLSPGVYCGGLTIGNTNGTAFTMSPGTYIMAGGGLVFNSQAVVKGTDVTVYNTSSAGWGCSSSYNYKPVTISGQVTATLSAPTSGAFNGILFFGNRNGCSTKGSCVDQINGGSTAVLNGALYFASDEIEITGSNASGFMMLVADKIYINGNSTFGNNGNPFDGITVSVSPSTATLFSGQTQQFTATVNNSANSAVTWTITPAGVGSISSSGLYTAPSGVTAQQTVIVTAASQADTSKSGTATVTLAVAKTTPTITWATPAAITYGTALGATQLDATTSVPGTFAYTPAAGTVLAAGSRTLSVTFTPTNTISYNTATASVPLTVNKATLTVTAGNASRAYGAANPTFTDTITGFVNGDTSSVVSGTPSLTTTATSTSVPGTYPITAVAGTLSAVNYSFSFVAGTLTVTSASQTITFPAPASPVTYGVSPITLSATSSSGLAVTFSVLSGPGTISGNTLTITGAGTVVVAANRAGNADYAAATQVTQSVVVNQATPVITWATPATITYGTALGATQLDATASVVGTFAYTPAAGAVLPAGSQTLSVTFTPTDTTDYTTATATVTLTVNNVPVSVSVTPPSVTLYGGQTQQFTASVTNSNNTAVSWTVSPSTGAGTISTTGLYTAPATITTQQTVTITATSQASATASASVPVTLMPPVAVNVTPPSATLYAGQTQQFTASVTNSSNQAVTWTYTESTNSINYPSGGFTATSLSLNGGATVTSGGLLQLTDGGGSEARSAWFTTEVPIQTFTTDFTFQQLNAGADGMTFTIQGQGSGALGGGGGGLGYSGIATSVAVKFDLYDNAGEGSDSTGLYTDGAAPTMPAVNLSSTGINLHSGDVMDAHLVYDGTNLIMTLTDTVTSALVTEVFPVNIPSIVGGNTAFVGFTGGAGGITATQNVLSWTYTSPPTVTSSDSSLLYTAPATISTQQTVTITATSQADTTQSASATVTLMPPVSVSVTPPSAILYGGQTQQFTATVTNTTNAAVTWTISPAGVGTINSSGLFTAPATIPARQTVTVTATSVTDSTKFAQATVTLMPAVSVSVTPSSATLYGSQMQQFTANVANATNTAVTWTISPAGSGAISASGLYTAPAAISAQQTVTVTATSVVDSAKFAQATVTLMLPVAVSVTPPSATLNDGQWQQFTATVTNATNTAVTWTITPAGVGMISQSGVYTAPAVINNPSNGFKATSLSLNGNATVTSGGLLQLTDGGYYEGGAAWYPAEMPIQTFITDFTFQLITPTSNSGADGITFTIQGLGAGALGSVGGGLGYGGIPTSVAVKFDTYNNVGEGIDSTGLYTDGAGPGVPAIDLTPTGINLHSGDVMNALLVYDGTNLAMILTDTVTNASATEVFPIDIPGIVGSNTAYVGFTGATGADTSTQDVLSWTYASFKQQTVKVTATSAADTTASASAVITVMPPAAVSATPASAVLYGGQSQQFTANVTNTSNTTVTWMITPATGAGTISTSGLFTAPASVATQQTVTITATSTANSAAFTTMTVILVPNVTLSVTPPNATLYPGQSQQFTANVTNNMNTAVTWTLSPAPSTIITAGLGTISTTGLYTAPTSFTTQQRVLITATSAVNSTAIATATVTLMPPSTGGAINIDISALSTVTLPNTLQLNGTVTDNTGLTPTITWSQVSGPGTVTFANPSQAVTTATFSQAGNYVLELSASDASPNSGSVQWQVTVNPVPGITQGWVGSPVNGSAISGVVPIMLASGVTLQSGILTYYPANKPDNVTVLNANATGSGQIGTLDTTTLVNGSYWIQLQATDANGDQQYSLVLVTVAGNYKPGRVTATVTDLVVPATGLAINIQRTYDSLNAATSSDFGYGWSLGINVNLTVDPKGDVTFTLGGQRKTFYLTPQQLGCSPLMGCVFPWYWPIFTPEPGLHGTLTDSAPGCADGLDIMSADGFCQDGSQYNPPGYIYTDPNGTSYTISATGNLQSIQDRSGNGLTITANGITSTTGLSVPFVRDSSNRITQITDPQGNIYSYGYDSYGNLATVTYPATAQSTTCPNTSAPNTSTYSYDSNHLYLSGTDGRCNPLPVAQYYPDGRLQSVSDALGETTSYAYNLATNTTTITYPPDANQNVGTATMVYDSYGDLLTSADPLGNTITNVYDANHNLTSTTDPLGHTSNYTYDSNGNKVTSTYPATATSKNTTSYTAYNQYSEPTSTTDELGNVRTFNYDTNYNPQSVTDSAGTLASFIFNANSTLAAGAIGYDISVQPAMASQFSYDANGNMASRTDALGRTTSYSYNSLGQKTAMVTPTPTTLTGGSASTTTYQYNALGNLTQTAAPLNRTTGSTYDANGNKLSDTDALGHVTSYQYDALNRLTTTTYPDGTTATKTYDFRNNVIRATDQAGNVTLNAYDLAGRLTSITRGSGTSGASTTSYAYDNASRKISETDALGHTTSYTYDADSRLIGLSGIKGNFTYAYDDAGNQISRTDANNNTTQFQYDARKRLIKTTNPDNTTVVNTYDGPGNLASVTDQASNTVQYTYDAANQLKTVVQLSHPNPSNNTNLYGYDPLGNLTGLTDENIHTTVNAFNFFNQPVQKILPDQTLTETRSYNAAGNLVSLTHFNGVTTTYTYNALNRLLTRTTPGEAPVSFTYTPTGKYLTSTAGDGTVNYDALDRLTTKATPEGTLSYTYDAAGHVASIASSNSNGASVAYAYDDLNRLSTVVDNRLHGNLGSTLHFDRLRRRRESGWVRNHGLGPSIRLSRTAYLRGK